MNLPQPIQTLIKNKPYTLDSTGLSGSRVLLFDDLVLKIEKADPDNRKTAAFMDWLQGKLPTPEILEFHTQDGLDYTLMTRVAGKMACDTEYLEQPELLLSLLAHTLKELWAVDTSACPRLQTPKELLKLARYRVEHDLVDVENAEPETFCPDGFRDPAHLLS